MTDPDLDDLLDLLATAGIVRTRKMFGGTGLYLEGVFFGLVADGRLFFRVDDESRGEYESAGSEPFQPFPDKPSMRTYFEVPERVQGDRRAMKTWTLRALKAARERDAKPKRATKSDAKRRVTKKTPRGTRIVHMGTVSRLWLEEVGVRTVEDLERKGSIATFRAVRRRGHPASEKLLYALEAALLGLRPDRLPDVVQANLRERAGL